jgi:stage III sporulation protein AD
MLGIIAAVIAVTLKKVSPEMALSVSLITGVIIFLGILGQLAQVVNVLRLLSENANLNDKYMAVIIRVIGIAYIAQLGMEMCKDAGENAIASKIEIAGKILILTVSIPVISGVVELITQVIP